MKKIFIGLIVLFSIVISIFIINRYIPTYTVYEGAYGGCFNICSGKEVELVCKKIY